MMTNKLQEIREWVDDDSNFLMSSTARKNFRELLTHIDNQDKVLLETANNMNRWAFKAGECDTEILNKDKLLAEVAEIIEAELKRRQIQMHLETNNDHRTYIKDNIKTLNEWLKKVQIVQK